MRQRLNLERAKAQCCGGCLRISFEALIACNMSLDTRDKLAWAERFYNVVICTKAKRTDFIDILKACGDHENRNIPFFAYGAAYGESIGTGQHEVEQD